MLRSVWASQQISKLEIVLLNVPHRARALLYRFLEKQDDLLINVQMRKKLDLSATGFALQGF
jgi:hypothetical protein